MLLICIDWSGSSAGQKQLNPLFASCSQKTCVLSCAQSLHFGRMLQICCLLMRKNLKTVCKSFDAYLESVLLNRRAADTSLILRLKLFSLNNEINACNKSNFSLDYSLFFLYLQNIYRKEEQEKWLFIWDFWARIFIKLCAVFIGIHCCWKITSVKHRIPFRLLVYSSSLVTVFPASQHVFKMFDGTLQSTTNQKHSILEAVNHRLSMDFQCLNEMFKRSNEK